MFAKTYDGDFNNAEYKSVALYYGIAGSSSSLMLLITEPNYIYVELFFIMAFCVLYYNLIFIMLTSNVIRAFNNEDRLSYWATFSCAFSFLSLLIYLNLQQQNFTILFSFFFIAVFLVTISVSKNWVFKNEIARVVALLVTTSVQLYLASFNVLMFIFVLFALIWFSNLGVLLYSYLVDQISANITPQNLFLLIESAINKNKF